MESTGQRQAAKVANERIHDYTAAGLSAEGQDPPNVKASKDVQLPDDPEEQKAAAELDRDAVGDDDKEVSDPIRSYACSTLNTSASRALTKICSRTGVVRLVRCSRLASPVWIDRLYEAVASRACGATAPRQWKVVLCSLLLYVPCAERVC